MQHLETKAEVQKTSAKLVIAYIYYINIFMIYEYKYKLYIPNDQIPESSHMFFRK